MSPRKDKNDTWYSNASHLDLQRQTRLGTLGYLPSEIRRLIWEILLPKKVHWRFDVPFDDEDACPYQFFVFINYDEKILEVASHGAYRVAPVISPVKFRDASCTIRDEFDAMLFSTRILHFESPTIMDKFIEQLSPFQRSHFFHLSVNIFTGCTCSGQEHCMRDSFPESIDQWLELFNDLPPQLKTIRVDLGNDQLCPFHRYDAETNAMRAMTMMECLELLEVLLRQGKECVPNATISMSTWRLEYVFPGKSEEFRSIFSQLES